MKNRVFKNSADRIGYHFGEICVVLSFMLLGIGVFAGFALCWREFFKLTLAWLVLYCYGNWRTGGDMEL